MKILTIIDDDPTITGYFEFKFRNTHKVIAFNNPLIALEEIPKINPDYIISDYLMFDMDGLELLQKLKSKGVTSKLILLTGVTLKDIKKYCDSNNIHYILKCNVNKMNFDFLIPKETTCQ